MHPQNIDLLQSQEALQKLASRDLRGVFALRLADILDEVEGRLQKLQGVQEDLSRRVDEGDLQQDEADEQWRELLQETLEINTEPIPRSALRTIEISVADLQTLSWLFEEPTENGTEGEPG
jgi:two-component sensor histidine kinase